MGPIVIISFVLLGAAAIVIQRKQRFQQIDMLHLLFVSALAVLLKLDFENQQSANVWTYSLITVLAVNFLLGRWSKLRKPILRIVPPLITFGLLFGIFWNDSFVYLGANFNVSDKATWALPLMGIVMFELAELMVTFLEKHLGMKRSAVNIPMIIFSGIAALIGAFNAQGYGVFLVATGFLAGSFYNNYGSKHFLHSLLGVALVWTFAEANSIEIMDLRFPKVIGGLFIGAFAAGFMQYIWTIEKRRTLAISIAYVITGLLFIGMLDVETRINTSFGGVEAFLGGLIGFSLANAVLYDRDREEGLRQSPIAMSVLVVIILVGMFVPPLLVNEEELAVQESLEAIAPKTDEGEEVEIPFIALDDLNGNYEVVQETAIISFKLGPAGSVTKGAIKEFTGNFSFSESLEQTSFDIKLPVLKLTTFMPMRDKSIMGEEYFNQEKFPTMRFKGAQMTATEKENEFELTGSFEMLGVKKDQKVRVHRIEEDGKIVLVGSGEVDRRDFGMADDPREGNIVEFDFKVELKK